MDYFDSYKEMLQLRGLHRNIHSSLIQPTSRLTLTILIRLALLRKKLRGKICGNSFFCRQTERSLADRTINAVISQLRFFRIYVLHQNWDPYQIPFRKVWYLHAICTRARSGL